MTNQTFLLPTACLLLAAPLWPRMGNRRLATPGPVNSPRWAVCRLRTTSSCATSSTTVATYCPNRPPTRPSPWMFAPTGAAPGRELWLQVGYTTHAEGDRTLAPPCAVALVVDCSGSMRERGKMSQVHRGLRAFVTRLRPDDQIAVVAFSSDARRAARGVPALRTFAGASEPADRATN